MSAELRARAHEPRCIHEMVGEQARRTPDAIAVSHGDLRLTYGELDMRSAALARRLRSAGVVRGDTVVVLLDRSIDLIVALTAVLRAGAAYLYLDPAEPPVSGSGSWPTPAPDTPSSTAIPATRSTCRSW